MDGIDLKECCAPGVTFQESYVPVDEHISLRVISFFPEKQTGNPEVLFISGWISRIVGWKDVLREMTSDFIVHYVETREKVSSRIDKNAAQSVEAIAGDLRQLVEHFNFKSGGYIFCGSSLGATAILEACREIKTPPFALILVGPNAVFRVPPLGLFIIRIFPPRLYLFIKPIVKLYLKLFRLNTEADRNQYVKYCHALDAADPWKLKKAALALEKYSVWDILPEVPFPTLILGGEKDNLHEPENLKKITALLPECSYLDMETNTRTHSAEMVKVMRKFLKEKYSHASDLNKG